MATFLFSEIIFGPIRSRRLGISLGINLLPDNNKWCNFDCIYCECGWNDQNPAQTKHLPSRGAVRKALEKKLLEMTQRGEIPDVITFAGNGEPTMHHEFAAIVDDTLALRDKYVPSAKVSVLSNGSMIDRRSVIEALKRVDNNILKFDSAIMETVRAVNQPVKEIDPDAFAEQMKVFEGKQIIQTMFLRGSWKGSAYDNTQPRELDAWEAWIVKVRPASVMIYSLDRDTPADGLQKISAAELEEIAIRIRRHGIPVSVAS